VTNTVQWLPPLVQLADYEGDWNSYLQAIYTFFEQDFVKNCPSFHGMKMQLKRQPVIEGKEATFWHIISEGKEEKDRIPDFRRCERIRWPRPLIENGKEPPLKIWSNVRKGEERICLWLEEAEYLVVLAKRSGYILLWTAYTTPQPHQKRKLQIEYEAFKRAGAAL
jgi:hypothetical protein